MTVIGEPIARSRPVPSAASLAAPTPASSTPSRPSWQSRWFKPGWPLAAIFVPFPLWWAMGMSEFVFLLFAVPMAFALMRRQRVSVPSGFGWWLLFLAWVGVGVAVLHVDAVGAVADSNSTRYLTWLYRLSWYLALTTIALYVLNFRKEISTVRVTRIVSFLFFAVVGGGLLGVLAPHFEFSSLLEVLLPKGVADTPFINHMIHPSAAQLQQVLGYSSPRPSAPYAYTNTWGLNYAVTLPFFVFAWLGKDAGRRRFVAPVILLVSAIPVIYSINRGMWVALLVMGLFVAARAALAGRPAMMGAVLLGVVAVVGVVSVTSLGSIVSARVSNAGSEQGRTNLGTLSVTSVSQTSPIVGLGSTRNVQGNFNTITGGATVACPRCAPPALGTQGQLWLVVYSQGLVGLIFYLTFFGLNFLRALRRHSPVTTMGLAVLVASFVTMPFYNALGSALTVVMIAVALLAREQSAGTGGVPPVALPAMGTYFGPLRRRVGLVLICGLIGLDLGAIWQQAHGVRYVASQSLLISDSRRLPSGGNGPMNLDTDAQLLASPAVTDAVLRTTGQSLGPDQDDLRVVAVPNSRVLRLSFEGNTSETATAGVLAASDAFLGQRQSQLNSEQSAEIVYLREQAARLDSSLRVLDAVLAGIEQNDPGAPIVQTHDTRERRSSLLTQIQQVNRQIMRITGDPVQAGSYLKPVKLTARNDVWNVSLASGLMLGLLAGVVSAMLLERKGPRLRRVRDVLPRTGLPVLAVIAAPPHGWRGVPAGLLHRAYRLLPPRPDGTGPSSRSPSSPLAQAALAMEVYDIDVAVAVSDDPHAAAVVAHLDQREQRPTKVFVPAADPVGVEPGQRAMGERSRVAIVVSQHTRARALDAMHVDLSRIGEDVVGVIFCD